MTWRVTLLGRVDATFDGSPCSIGGPTPQRLVAALAMASGRTVHTDRLIDLLWGEKPPAAARRTLQAHVSKVRAATAGSEFIQPIGDGYTMCVERDRVDLLAWHDQASTALALVDRDPSSAAAQLLDLAARFERPLGGLRITDEMDATIAPLRALHDQVQEGLVTAQIDAGDTLAAVRRLEDMTRADPTNEALWFQLARGLAQLDRRRSALDAIRRARTSLREQLGLELGNRLADLELTLLNEGIDVSANSVDGSEHRLRNHNLRPHPNEFVDRPEIDRIKSLLTAGRVTTIVGPGGIGKSRCGDAVARACVDDGSWADGVWFVDLAALPEEAPNVAAAVAGAIGLGRDDVAPTGRTIGSYLGTRSVLLLLDNCEHVLGAVRSFLAELFATVSDTAVLATSRLRVETPHEYTVVLEVLSEQSSRELCEARIAEAGAGPFPTDDVDELCSAVGHYPLALELAAARTRLLSPQEITRRLERQPAFTGERVHLGLSADADAGTSRRHSSLRVALDWSLEQLPARARTTLNRMAVFPTDFDIAAAESILAIDGSGADLLDDLAVLVEHHLVSRDHERSRFRLLEPIRQTLIAHEPVSTDVHRRHARYYAAEARRVGAGIFTSDEARCWDSMDRELTHLGEAVRWAAEHHDLDVLETAMQPMAMVIALNVFTTPGDWADDAIARLETEAADTPWTTLAAAAGRIFTNRPEQCDALLDTLEPSLTDPRMLATLYLVRIQRDQTQADRWLDALEEAATKADDSVLIAVAHIRRVEPGAVEFADRHTCPSLRAFARSLAYARWDDSQKAKPIALEYIEDFYRLALTSNCAHTIAHTQILMGTVLCRSGHTAQGVAIALESIERMCRLRSPHQVWNVVEGMANLLVIMQTMPETAAALWAAVDATEHPPLAREFRDPARPLWVNSVLTADEIETAREEGGRLSMDEAVAITRKAVEQLADLQPGPS